MNLSKKIDEILTSRLALWAISVAIASLMWFFIGGYTHNETLRILARIEFLNLQPHITVRSSVNEVLLELEAPAGVMQSLAYDSIVSEVDLRGFSSGKFRPVVRPRLPPNVILRSMSPTEIDVELLRQVSRILTVDVTLPQDIPAGYYLEAVEIVPREVNIRGTEGDVAKIGSVSIAPTFSELQTGMELLLPVSIAQSEPFEDEVILEPTQVRINAALVAGIPRRRVPVNVRLAGRPSSDYEIGTIIIDPAEVTLQGDREILDRISAVDTEMIDITNLSADQVIVVPLRAFEEEDVSILNASAVRLSIQLEPVFAQKLISNVEISVEGSAEHTEWSVVPPVVGITLEAPPSVIETLDLEYNLKTFVDVSGIFLRQAVLPVWAESASDSFRVVNVEPSTVTVNVVGE